MSEHLSWDAVRLPEGGARLRAWFRPLASNVFATLLQPQCFHTWLELVAADGAEVEGAPLAVGIYEKDLDGEAGRAVLMEQSWEHEDEQLAHYNSGYVLTSLPDFDAADFERFCAFVHDGRREAIGMYSWFGAWVPGWENCMTWVEGFVQAKGGDEDIIARLRLALQERLTHPFEGRRH